MHQAPPRALASVPPLPVIADPPRHLIRADLWQLLAQRVHLTHRVSAPPPNDPVTDCFIDGPAALSGRDPPEDTPGIVVDHDVDPLAHGRSALWNSCGYDYTLGLEWLPEPVDGRAAAPIFLGRDDLAGLLVPPRGLPRVKVSAAQTSRAFETASAVISATLLPANCLDHQLSCRVRAARCNSSNSARTVSA